MELIQQIIDETFKSLGYEYDANTNLKKDCQQILDLYSQENPDASEDDLNQVLQTYLQSLGELVTPNI